MSADWAVFDTFRLHCGDCRLAIPSMPDGSVDSIVTDPPYGISFMGEKWDYDVPSVEVWAECLRVLKPGGHLLAFAGTRTQHRMAVRIEDAGFEIRDMIAWVYRSGFPKSLDVSKAIDKAAGVEREKGPIDPSRAARLVNQQGNYETDSGWSAGGRSITVDPPATPEARQWSGWGTALKPAFEPITVARKPLMGTVAENVLAYGTGAINVDGCRVGTESTRRPLGKPLNGGAYGSDRSDRETLGAICGSDAGRWPANLIHDGSDEALAAFPSDRPGAASNSRSRAGNAIYGDQNAMPKTAGRGDSGSAARFFYCAKASKAERGDANNHPTVKPVDLMRYLCRLVTPPGGIVFDPFMGSGSTGVSAIMEGFGFIGMERDQGYYDTAAGRIVVARDAMRFELPVESSRTPDFSLFAVEKG